MSHSDSAAAVGQHIHRDDVGAKMGMWLFLFTELLLFGGLFLIYAVYRFSYPEQFHIAGMELNVGVGTLNTIILLTSSLTVAISIEALRRKNKFLSLVMLASTLVFALFFMINKYFEWTTKFDHGIYPGSETMLNGPDGEILFFGLYYTMTGLHALHVIIGIIVLSFMFIFIVRDKVKFDNYVKLENSGLYWHLVDLIWIFLFPLFYLIQ